MVRPIKKRYQNMDVKMSIMQRLFALEAIYHGVDNLWQVDQESKVHSRVEDKALEKHILQKWEDLPQKCKLRQLDNIKAVMGAYGSGKLDWKKGFVTYSSKEKQLCPPRPFV